MGQASSAREGRLPDMDHFGSGLSHVLSEITGRSLDIDLDPGPGPGPPPSPRSSSTGVVQIYNATHTGLTRDINQQLMDRLGPRLPGMEGRWQEFSTDDPNHIQPDHPIVVLCVNATRLGTDVDEALTGLTAGHLQERVACVVVHYQGAPRDVTPSSELLVAPLYKKFDLIVDMPFVEGKGFYECSSEIDKLVKFIDSEPVSNKQSDSLTCNDA